MTGFDSDDPTDRAARDAAAVFHGESLTGAPLPRSDRPRPRPATTTAPRRRALDHSLTSPPIGARADAEVRWLASTTHELRRLLPDEPSDDENASSNLGTSFVRIRRDETRHARAEPARRRTHPAAPRAPPGRVHRPHRTTRAHRRVRVRPTNPVVPKPSPGPKAARRRRRRTRASATRERRRPFRSDDPSVDANLAHDRRGSDPGCFDRFGRSGRPGSSPALRDAPVVPRAGRSPSTSALRRRLRGFLRLEDATGWTRVACLGLPDARALGRRVVATAWLRPRGGGAVEVASFEVLDADPTKPKTAIRWRSRRTRRTPRLRPRGKVVSTPSARWWR